MEKKVAVVTIWDTQDNYGQILQCYALQRCLIRLGCDAYLIKTKPDVMAPTCLKQRIWNKIAKLFSRHAWELLYFRYKLKVFLKRYGHIDRGFDAFRQSYIQATEKVFDIDELRTGCPDADIYITGSDQVWGSLSEIFFLDFVAEDKRKYSYAASFGSNTFSRENCRKMSHYLKSFDGVTVREYSGVEKCKFLGCHAQRIIDPTGLLTDKDYLQIATLPNEKGYILLYLLGNFTDVDIDAIYRYAKQKGVEVKYVASQGRNDKYAKIFPSPTEWLGLIAHAGYVITNSYHCCMFSMFFQKKFMALKLTGVFAKMNTRMDTLFVQYKVPKVETLSELASTPFDYAETERLLEKDRINAIEIVKTWLKE